MKAFVDTNVMMAAFWDNHPHYAPSRALIESLNKTSGSTSAHCFAELYSGLTNGAVGRRLSPAQTLLYIEQMRQRLTVIVLSEREIFDTLEEAAGLAITGGGIFDALIGRAAIKSKAKYIYTHNLKHFHRLGDAVAKRLRVPA
jgi:predicted nucleic acid-binding protein